MKNFLKSTVALTLLFATTMAMANEPKISLETLDNSKSIVLQLNSQPNESTIKLIDENANAIYNESIPSNDYAKKFNLEDLADGTYYFLVQNDRISVTYTLNVDSEDIHIVKKEENLIKPVFRMVGDRLYVHLINTDQEKVEIEIVDSRNRTMFQESIAGGTKVAKTFNFEKAVRDNYTIIVKDGGEIYFKNIKVG